jgi:hypothetical protein
MRLTRTPSVETVADRQDSASDEPGGDPIPTGSPNGFDDPRACEYTQIRQISDYSPPIDESEANQSSGGGGDSSGGVATGGAATVTGDGGGGVGTALSEGERSALTKWWEKRWRHYVDEEMGALIRAWHAVHPDKSLVEQRKDRNEPDENLFGRVLGLRLDPAEVEYVLDDMDSDRSGAVDKNEAQRWWEQYSDDLSKFDRAWDTAMAEALAVEFIRPDQGDGDLGIKFKVCDSDPPKTAHIEGWIANWVPPQIAHIVPTGLAAQKPELFEGLQLRSVQGKNIVGMDGEEILHRIRQSRKLKSRKLTFVKSRSTCFERDKKQGHAALNHFITQLLTPSTRLAKAAAAAIEFEKSKTSRSFEHAVEVSNGEEDCEQSGIEYCEEGGRGGGRVWIKTILPNTPASRNAQQHPDKLREGMMVETINRMKVETIKDAMDRIQPQETEGTSGLCRSSVQPGVLRLGLKKDAAQEWWSQRAKKRTKLDKTVIHSQLTSINSLSSLFLQDADAASDTDREREQPEDEPTEDDSSFDLLLKQWERLHVTYFEKHTAERLETRMDNILKTADALISLEDIISGRLFALSPDGFSNSEEDNDLLLQAMGAGLPQQVELGLLAKSAVQQWWSRYCMRDQETFEQAWAYSHPTEVRRAELKKMTEDDYEQALSAAQGKENRQLEKSNTDAEQTEAKSIVGKSKSQFIAQIAAFEHCERTQKIKTDNHAIKADNIQRLRQFLSGLNLKQGDLDDSTESGLSISSSRSGYGDSGLSSHMVQSDDHSGFDIKGDPTKELRDLLTDSSSSESLGMLKKYELLKQAVEHYERDERNGQNLTFTLRVHMQQGHSLEAKVREQWLLILPARTMSHYARN